MADAAAPPPELGPPIDISAAAAGAGAGGPSDVLAAAARNPWYETILRKLGYFASLPGAYVRMAISRITATPRPTLEELAELTVQTSYHPPGWLSALLKKDPVNTMAINAVLSGARAHAAAFKVLRSYIIFRYFYDRNAPETLRQVEILCKDILLYNVYTYYKYKNRAGLQELAQQRPNIPMAAYAEASQSYAIDEGVVGNEQVKVETMPWELADALNAIVRMYPGIAARYGLEAGRGARESSTPPHIVGIPDPDDAVDTVIDAAMEPHIQKAEDILMGLEELWAGVNGGKPVNREQLREKLGIISKPGDPKELLDRIIYGVEPSAASAPVPASAVPEGGIAGRKRGRTNDGPQNPGSQNPGSSKKRGGYRNTRKLRKRATRKRQHKARSTRRRS